jgi:hypothetical protein
MLGVVNVMTNMGGHRFDATFAIQCPDSWKTFPEKLINISWTSTFFFQFIVILSKLIFWFVIPVK